MLIEQRKSYKYLICFIAAFIAFYLTQEVLLNRLISIAGGYITGGTFIYFASPLIVDVVAEIYGYKVARQMIWCGLLALLFFAFSIFICFKMPYPYFWMRSFGSSVIGDSITVILTTLGTFLGRVPMGVFVQNLVPELTIMIIFSLAGAIPAMFLVKILAKAEGVNRYDVFVNYNPFKMDDKKTAMNVATN